MSLQLQNGKTYDEGEASDGNSRQHHGEPGIDGISGCQNPGNIGTKTKEGRVPERNLTGEPEQQVQSDGKHRIDTDKNQYVQQVIACEKKRCHQDGNRKE